MNENVVQMPSKLDRLADKFRGLLDKETTNHEEWIELQMDICLTLAEMRRELPANIKFGQWCEANGFGESRLDHVTRARAIEMAREPDALRQCLNETGLKSLRRIYLQDWPRFSTCAKTTPVEPKKRGRPKTKVTREMVEEIHRRIECGGPIREMDLMKMFGVGEKTIERATVQAWVEHEMRPAAAAPLSPTEMPRNMRAEYDAAVRAARKEIRDEEQSKAAEAFRAKETALHEQYDLFVKRYSERLAVADKLLNNYAGIMNEEEYKTILHCLHPDSRMRDATKAFQIFMGKKPLLVKLPPRPFSGPPLPQTAADLLRQRKVKRG